MVFIELFLNAGDGRVGCALDALAVAFTVSLVAALVFCLTNGDVRKRVGEKFVTAAAVTAMIFLVLPLFVCSGLQIGRMALVCR
jgi:uncharacterized membrane protein